MSSRTSLTLAVLVWTTCGAVVGGVVGYLALVGAFVTVGAHIGLPKGRRYPELERERPGAGALRSHVERDRRWASRHLDLFWRY